MFYSVRPSFILRSFMRKALWRVATNEKKIYLTFDDGPVEHVTPVVLDVLDAFDAKATFFCVGKNVEKRPALFSELKMRGHAVANHSNDHLHGWKNNNALYFENVDRCHVLVNSRLFRPPYGKLKPSQYAFLSRKYKLVMWDVLACDFDPHVSKEKCLDNVIKHTRPGSIVLFHDSLKAKEKVEFALPKFLGHFRTEGYTFEKLEA